MNTIGENNLFKVRIINVIFEVHCSALTSREFLFTETANNEPLSIHCIS